MSVRALFHLSLSNSRLVISQALPRFGNGWKESGDDDFLQTGKINWNISNLIRNHKHSLIKPIISAMVILEGDQSEHEKIDHILPNTKAGKIEKSKKRKKKGKGGKGRKGKKGGKKRYLKGFLEKTHFILNMHFFSFHCK